MYLTYQEIVNKVKAQCDLEDEVFIDADELMGHCNDAIKRCESKIHTIYEDYFVTEGPLTLTNGSYEVNMPSDIYANKIRSIVYNNGSKLYEIKRIKEQDKFMLIEDRKNNPSSDLDYMYWIKNASATTNGRKIILSPVARETSSNTVTIYYLRRANTITSETDYVDIPEFYSVIVAYMKYQAYLKEGHPNTATALEEYGEQEKNMVETLSEMVPDGDSTIPIDPTFYTESEA
jgi:hypothetical protein